MEGVYYTMTGFAGFSGWRADDRSDKPVPCREQRPARPGRRKMTTNHRHAVRTDPEFHGSWPVRVHTRRRDLRRPPRPFTLKGSERGVPGRLTIDILNCLVIPFIHQYR